jgi:hypothetical protein
METKDTKKKFSFKKLKWCSSFGDGLDYEARPWWKCMYMCKMTRGGVHMKQDINEAYHKLRVARWSQ